jgi:hypothetical protein
MLQSVYDVYIGIPLRIERAVRGRSDGERPRSRASSREVSRERSGEVAIQ